MFKGTWRPTEQLAELIVGRHYSLADRIRLRCRQEWRQFMRAKGGTASAGSYWYSFGEACDFDGDVLKSVRRLNPSDNLDAKHLTHVVLILSAGSRVYLPLVGQRRRLLRTALGTTSPAKAAGELAAGVLGVDVPKLEAVATGEVMVDEDQSRQRWLVCHAQCGESRLSGDRLCWLTSKDAPDAHLIDRAILRELAAWRVLSSSSDGTRW